VHQASQPFVDRGAVDRGLIADGRHHRLSVVAGRHLQRLTAPRIASFYGELLTSGRRDGKGLTPKTVRNVHTLLHRALKDAARWGYVPHKRG
jgi:hypothetical protein